MKNKLKMMIACGCLLTAAPLAAQMQLVKKGKPVARIVCQDTTAVNKRAVELLNRFIKRISGAELPVIVPSGPESSVIKSGTTPHKGQIIIGGHTGKAGEDGFEINCRNGSMQISTGSGKGSIYGVATLLERYMGVNYYARNTYTLTKSNTIQLPAITLAETPAFRYRQTYSYGNEDPDYYDWFRLEDPAQMFASNLWVHTFNRLLPAAVYGKAHPEYYAMINGRRQPGAHSQWCLSNPDVFNLAVQKIDSIFKANPGRNMISVSQNDGNDTYCTCPECKAVDSYEGSPSGSLIRFLNKLARRFPDKEFSTLAYLYSVRPPRHTKPLPNVNIMLCDIDCKREVPLTDNESGREFMQALEGWSKISNNLFIWDYGINFDNLVSPFPNFHILKDNINLFKKNHATMLFEQVNGTRGTDFSEMRAYMLSKLMWNPALNADSLMRQFMNGYYGPAAPYLYQYQKLLEGGLLSSGTPLWIYDSPVSHKRGMLNRTMRKACNRLFDEAEQAVAGDTTLLDRVRLSRLPLQFADLEIERTIPGGNPAQRRAQVELFRQRATKYGVTALTERGISPDEYCRNYLKRFLPSDEVNLARNARITWLIAPEEKYRPIAETALTDGLFGGNTYVESWVGWQGKNAEFILDLGEIKDVRSISTDFLRQLSAWVLLPEGVDYAWSADNKSYQAFGSFNFKEDRNLAAEAVEGRVDLVAPVPARYLKVFVRGTLQCPDWHYGVGHPSWFFIDEITVR